MHDGSSLSRGSWQLLTHIVSLTFHINLSTFKNQEIKCKMSGFLGLLGTSDHLAVLGPHSHKPVSQLRTDLGFQFRFPSSPAHHVIFRPWDPAAATMYSFIMNGGKKGPESTCFCKFIELKWKQLFHLHLSKLGNYRKPGWPCGLRKIENSTFLC